MDGVGSFLLLLSDRVTLGRSGSSARPDVALAADISGVQAEIVRAGDDYFLAARGAVEVNGRAVEKKLLASGDRIALSPRCQVVFRQPTPLSASAVLSLAGGQRIAGDAREVILLHHLLIIGSGEGSHVRAEGAPRILLSASGKGLSVRSEEEILVDGTPRGRETLIRPGERVKVGEVTFTVTPWEDERS